MVAKPCRDTEPWCKLHTKRTQALSKILFHQLTTLQGNSQDLCAGELTTPVNKHLSKNPEGPCPSILSRNSQKLYATMQGPSQGPTGSLRKDLKSKVMRSPHKRSFFKARTISSQGPTPKIRTAPQQEQSKTKSTWKGLRKLHTPPQQQVQKCRKSCRSQSQISTT